MNILDIQRRNVVTIARHRIACGYYDSPAVLDETVRRVNLCIAIDYTELERERAEWDKANDGEGWDGQ